MKICFQSFSLPRPAASHFLSFKGLVDFLFLGFVCVRGKFLETYAFVFVFNLWVYVYGSVFLCLIGTDVFLGRFMMNMVVGFVFLGRFMMNMVFGLCFCV